MGEPRREPSRLTCHALISSLNNFESTKDLAPQARQWTPAGDPLQPARFSAFRRGPDCRFTEH